MPQLNTPKHRKPASIWIGVSVACSLLALALSSGCGDNFSDLEVLPTLVDSDRRHGRLILRTSDLGARRFKTLRHTLELCLLYTSDAADDLPRLTPLCDLLIHLLTTTAISLVHTTLLIPQIHNI